MATVLEHLVGCGISEAQARTHLQAGHVRVNGVTVTGEFELPTQDDGKRHDKKPSIAIHPY